MEIDGQAPSELKEGARALLTPKLIHNARNTGSTPLRILVVMVHPKGEPGVVPVAQDKLGRVTFPTPCAASVQPSFERGLAMLHSYWLSEARKVFEAVLQQDPSCAIAYWGPAVNYLGNPLAVPPSSSDLAAALKGLETARTNGAKSQRERDWLEAIGVYYGHADQVPLGPRLDAYTKAMEQMTQRYPDDCEAGVYASPARIQRVITQRT